MTGNIPEKTSYTEEMSLSPKMEDIYLHQHWPQNFTVNFHVRGQGPPDIWWETTSKQHSEDLNERA